MCEYRKETKRFFDSLKLPASKFDFKHDYCFCDACHNERGDRDHYERGIPSNIYVLPRGWRRFGLRVDDTKNDSLKAWHVAFHGTKVENVYSILQTGLRIPGDETYDGKVISEREGHFRDGFKPNDDFDTKQIFCSPAITYTGSEVYASSIKWQNYKAKVAFQLRINPDSYKIGPKTTDKSSIDKYIPDSQLEWFTKEKESIVLTGLLVKLSHMQTGETKSTSEKELKDTPEEKNPYDCVLSLKLREFISRIRSLKTGVT